MFLITFWEVPDIKTWHYVHEKNSFDSHSKMQKPQFSKKWPYASLKLGVPGPRPFGLRAL